MLWSCCFIICTWLWSVATCSGHVVEPADNEDDRMFELYSELFFGSESQRFMLVADFQASHVVLLDESCGNVTDECKSYCSEPGFCDAFCPSSCCVDDWFMEECPKRRYRHNSTSFELVSSSWHMRRDYAVSTGILVRDHVVINTAQGNFSLGRLSFASMIITVLPFPPFWAGTLGYGLHPEQNSIAEVLHRQGWLYRPTIAVVPPYMTVVAGAFEHPDCVDWHRQPSVFSFAWVLLAEEYTFFSEHERRPTRIALSLRDFRVSQRLLDTLFAKGVLVDVPYPEFEDIRHAHCWNASIPYTASWLIDGLTLRRPLKHSQVPCNVFQTMLPSPDRLDFMMDYNAFNEDPRYEAPCYGFDYQTRMISVGRKRKSG